MTFCTPQVNLTRVWGPHITGTNVRAHNITFTTFRGLFFNTSDLQYCDNIQQYKH